MLLISCLKYGFGVIVNCIVANEASKLPLVVYKQWCIHTEDDRSTTLPRSNALDCSKVNINVKQLGILYLYNISNYPVRLEC